jgi:hypothetical protein
MKRPTTFSGWTHLGIDMPIGSDAEYVFPSWDRVLVVEEVNGQRGDDWTTVDEFEPRFRAILQRTSRDWVNLHFDRIDAGVLRLVVEYLVDDSTDRRVPADRISVNLSGPTKAWLDGLPRRSNQGWTT